MGRDKKRGSLGSKRGKAWVLVLCGHPEPSLAQKRPLAQPGGGQGQDDKTGPRMMRGCGAPYVPY